MYQNWIILECQCINRFYLSHKYTYRNAIKTKACHRHFSSHEKFVWTKKNEFIIIINEFVKIRHKDEEARKRGKSFFMVKERILFFLHVIICRSGTVFFRILCMDCKIYEMSIKRMRTDGEEFWYKVTLI
jgi:hypothetical protein